MANSCFGQLVQFTCSLKVRFACWQQTDRDEAESRAEANQMAGYFSLNHTQMAPAQDLFGQLWKEYALSDSRYLTSDPFVLCMETVTAVRYPGPLLCKINTDCWDNSSPGAQCASSLATLLPPPTHSDTLFKSSSALDKC